MNRLEWTGRAPWIVASVIVGSLVLGFTGDPRQRIVVRCLDETGLPKRGVPLELHCPGNMLGRPETTDELGATGPDGYLRYAGIGSHPADCRVRLAADPDVFVAVRDACRRKRLVTRSCVEIEAELIVK